MRLSLIPPPWVHGAMTSAQGAPRKSSPEGRMGQKHKAGLRQWLPGAGSSPEPFSTTASSQCKCPGERGRAEPGSLVTSVAMGTNLGVICPGPLALQPLET